MLIVVVVVRFVFSLQVTVITTVPAFKAVILNEVLVYPSEILTIPSTSVVTVNVPTASLGVVSIYKVAVSPTDKLPMLPNEIDSIVGT